MLNRGSVLDGRSDSCAGGRTVDAEAWRAAASAFMRAVITMARTVGGKSSVSKPTAKATAWTTLSASSFMASVGSRSASIGMPVD